MASSPAVATLSSSFSGSAISPGHAKQAVFEHLAETPRLARVTAASHLEIRPAPATVSFGIGELDVLTGGLPQGCLTEIVGPDSSGRTSVLLAALAAATQRGEICALIDATDSFHPHSAAAAGVDLSRLLWVRCTRPIPLSEEGSAASNANSQKNFKTASTFKSVPSNKTVSSKPTKRAAGTRTREQRPSRQLRESRDGYVTAETYRGAPDSPGLRTLFQPSSSESSSTQPSSLQTSSLQTSSLQDSHERATSHSVRKAQRNLFSVGVSNASQEADFLQQSDLNFSQKEDARERWKRRKMEDPVERALRATDLLLQSGGFGMVAIDLAGVPIKTARRVPLTTWFRFRRVIESTPTAMLLIGEQACAQTCASLSLNLVGAPSLAAGRRPLAQRLSVVGSALSPSHTQLLEGLHLQAEVLRGRSDRKPMQSVTHFQVKRRGRDDSHFNSAKTSGAKALEYWNERNGATEAAPFQNQFMRLLLKALKGESCELRAETSLANGGG